MSTIPDTAEQADPIAPSQAVVERVAAAEGVDHTDLDPLYNAIDPDALDRLVGTTARGDAGIRIDFSYFGYEITVTGDGVVHLEAGTDADEGSR